LAFSKQNKNYNHIFDIQNNQTEIKQRRKRKKKKKNDEAITMAGGLTNVASQILGGNGVVHRSVASYLRLRSGMGLPDGKHYVPNKPVRFS